jgi:hypothetical protein
LLQKVKELEDVTVINKASISTCFVAGAKRSKRFVGFTSDKVRPERIQLFLNKSRGHKFNDPENLTMLYPEGTVGVVVTPDTIDDAFEIVKQWYRQVKRTLELPPRCKGNKNNRALSQPYNKY